MKKYRTKLKINRDLGGPNRKYEIVNNALENNKFNVNPVTYKDIDNEVTKWVENELSISYDNTLLPTMTLFSNQRFTEYSQTWSYTDENKNVLMNFKTVNRENNPQVGSMQKGSYNIPDNKFYTVSKHSVLDDDGNISFIKHKMRQPFAVDLKYNINIITNKFELLNEFNIIIQNKFKSLQCYIAPNGHYMPLTLASIIDETVYQQEDRMFYKQSYYIVIHAYIITKDDIEVEEVPSKQILCFETSNNRPLIEVEDLDVVEYDSGQDYYYKPTKLTIDFTTRSNMVKFVMDSPLVILKANVSNISKYEIWVNDYEIDCNYVKFNSGDEIKVKIKRYYIDKESKIEFNGYNDSIVFDQNKDNPETIDRLTQLSGEINVEN